MIKIFVDGSSKGNPGPGGSGVIVYDSFTNTILYSFSQQYEHTTNNQAELKALLYALKLTQEKFQEEYCIIYSDSAYCVNICTNWIHNWAKNNWKNSKGNIVENIEIIKLIYKYLNIKDSNFNIQKISGHSGDIGNELADALATNNQKKFDKIFKENDMKFSLRYFLDKI